MLASLISSPTLSTIPMKSCAPVSGLITTNIALDCGAEVSVHPSRPLHAAPVYVKIISVTQLGHVHTISSSASREVQGISGFAAVAQVISRSMEQTPVGGGVGDALGTSVGGLVGEGVGGGVGGVVGAGVGGGVGGFVGGAVGDDDGGIVPTSTLNFNSFMSWHTGPESSETAMTSASAQYSNVPHLSTIRCWTVSKQASGMSNNNSSGIPARRSVGGSSPLRVKVNSEIVRSIWPVLQASTS